MKNELIQDLKELEKFQELTQEIEMKKTPINISGLVFVGKSHITAAIKQAIPRRSICIVTYNEIQAKKLCQDLHSFGEKIWYFPKREIAAYDYVAQSKDLPYERIAVLNQIILAEREKRPIIIVTTIEAIM